MEQRSFCGRSYPGKPPSMWESFTSSLRGVDISILDRAPSTPTSRFRRRRTTFRSSMPRFEQVFPTFDGIVACRLAWQSQTKPPPHTTPSRQPTAGSQRLNSLPHPSERFSRQKSHLARIEQQRSRCNPSMIQDSRHCLPERLGCPQTASVT